MSTKLPEIIATYLAARDGHDVDAALGTFHADATVIDENQTYDGHEPIRRWLDTGASEYTYTRTLIDVEEQEGGAYIVRNHLEGNFPGGQVDLRYQFEVDDDLIRTLRIAP